MSAAERLWSEVYEKLTKDQPGLTGKLLARSESHVLRLSALYALYARSNTIETEHLLSALALWDYAEASVRRIFGHRTGRPGADRVASELMVGETLSHTELRSRVFSNHLSQAALDDDLQLLKKLGMIQSVTQQTGGRPMRLITRTDPEAQTKSAPPCAASASSAESRPSLAPASEGRA